MIGGCDDERTTHPDSASHVGLLLAAHLLHPAPVTHAAAAETPPLAEPAVPVLRARVIELVDDRGVTRAQLKIESDGEAVFRMRDATGAIRVKLGASEKGSGLLLLNEKTEPGVQALARSEGASITLEQAGKDKRVLTP